MQRDVVALFNTLQFLKNEICHDERFTKKLARFNQAKQTWR